MAKLYNFLAIALVLVISASLSLAIDNNAPLSKNEHIVADFINSPAGKNLYRDELKHILISAAGQKLFDDAGNISPAASSFLHHEIDRIDNCADQLTAGRLDECMVTVYDVLEQKDGPAWEDQCCRNIVRVEQECWDVLFPNNRKGKDLLPILLGYCNIVVQAPARAPGLSPSA